MRYALALFLALATALLYQWRTDGFSLARIQTALFDQPDAPPLTAEIPKTFRYLAKGKQTFVFENGDFVLKLFNASELKKPWRLYFPFAREKKETWWREKIRIFPESYPLALRHLSPETGVLIAHLGRSDQTYPIVQLFDKTGRCHTVDLNATPFVLQKKGVGSFYRALERKEDLEALIDAYLGFQERRIGLCIADHDRNLVENYCWDGAAIQYIDPARCYYDPKLGEEKKRAHEWWKGTHRLRKWLEENAPEKLEYYVFREREIFEGKGG